MKQVNEQPKISIITVVFNGAKTLEQTILSVVNQTYANIEYIIIDGGSTDGTMDIIKKYEDRIAYWVSEPDEGIYDAMNKGIDVAKGEWIYFIGADDWLVDYSVIRIIVHMWLHDRKIDLFIGRIWYVDYGCGMKKLSSILVKEELYKGIHHQSMFVKNYLYKMNFFDLRYKVASDYDFVLKCLKIKNLIIECVDFPIAYYSLSGFSSQSFSLATKEFMEIIDKNNFTKDKKENFTNSTGRGEKNIHRIARILFKKIFIKIHFWKYIKYYQGWQDHD